MKKLRIVAVFEYDEDMMHGDDEESIRWFTNDILLGEVLLVHSDEIGDSIGTLNILNFAEDES